MEKKKKTDETSISETLIFGRCIFGGWKQVNEPDMNGNIKQKCIIRASWEYYEIFFILVHVGGHL